MHLKCYRFRSVAQIQNDVCQVYGIKARKEDIRLILKELDPLGVEERRSRCLRRRSYYAKGPNYIWHVDGYDKLKPYGLCISGCIDGFSRKIVYLNVYHTNNNPRVIGGYFLQSVKECGGCPHIVRGDFGTENGHVQDFQHFLQQHDTDSLVQTAYIEEASTLNQRIESWWGFLRKECDQFWMDLLDLSQRGSYDGSFFDKSLIQFCFTSLIQVSVN